MACKEELRFFISLRNSISESIGAAVKTLPIHRFDWLINVPYTQVQYTHTCHYRYHISNLLDSFTKSSIVFPDQ